MTISATEQGGEVEKDGVVPQPPSRSKKSTDILNGNGGRGYLFSRKAANHAREASYKRLMKARAETRGRKHVKDERLVRNIRDIPIEWHGTQSLIEEEQDGPNAWAKSLFGMLAGKHGGGGHHGGGHHGGGHHGGGHHGGGHHEGVGAAHGGVHHKKHVTGNHHHGHHYASAALEKHVVKKSKTALEKHLDALVKL